MPLLLSFLLPSPPLFLSHDYILVYPVHPSNFPGPPPPSPAPPPSGCGGVTLFPRRPLASVAPCLGFPPHTRCDPLAPRLLLLLRLLWICFSRLLLFPLFLLLHFLSSLSSSLLLFWFSFYFFFAFVDVSFFFFFIFLPLPRPFPPLHLLGILLIRLFCSPTVPFLMNTTLTVSRSPSSLPSSVVSPYLRLPSSLTAAITVIIPPIIFITLPLFLPSHNDRKPAEISECKSIVNRKILGHFQHGRNATTAT